MLSSSLILITALLKAVKTSERHEDTARTSLLSSARKLIIYFALWSYESYARTRSDTDISYEGHIHIVIESDSIDLTINKYIRLEIHYIYTLIYSYHYMFGSSYDINESIRNILRL